MTPRGLCRLIAIFPTLLLTTCAEPPSTAADTESSEPFEPVTRVYHCAGEQGSILLVTRTRPEGMSIFLPPSLGEQHRLLREVEAGTRYEADGTEVRIGERTADLVLPDAHYPDCVFDPRASVWEHAKLGGADFRGLGNEPGWALEVRAQSRLWFSYDYGASEVSAAIVETRSDPQTRSTTYVGRAGSAELLVTLTGEPCADTMADDTYPTRVEVTLDGRVFRGCGRPLH
ncbi:MAG: COG3650 family protein [Pseudomonadales bacterium]